MLKLFIVFLSVALLMGNEYDFDISDVKPKKYEYGGYLRVDDRLQKLDKGDDKYQNYIHTEALFDFSYFYEQLTFESSVIYTRDYINNKQNEDDLVVNELYFEAKLDTYNSFLAGKKSLKWGKGYFFNPVAFFDREKDPSQPTQVREGYSILKYSYNKSFIGDLKNLSFDFVYLPSSNAINQDFDKNSNNLATRLYLLYFDTDIDFIYNYSNKKDDKIGIDFSKNLQTNFEIHGEYAKVINADEAYLVGLRYLTDYELTVISEYLNDEDDYFVTQLTQKEPYNILYFSIYAKNYTNLDDDSMQNKIGISYSFKNNIDADISYNKNSGNDLSEFGSKPVSDFVWLQIKWNY
ncbi:hypothetical protein FJR48_05430 [Sulfurimonas lithotrophica]|uniref:Porin domain-containing protein n=1 Tax=Sulfurimonas lithotrophica TaxID=2590022 RepID=A0A5P8P0T2_9BACT|nr:hypothetical protein [Sulfurimonas lithotrophica]QFR49197.1 hypothetical protein FJR48_05430 [Sulfurimonas lithotrophica]